MRMTSKREWADLPKELVESIGNRLQDCPADIIRFRSVCNSWRSSTPFPSCREVTTMFATTVHLPLSGSPEGVLVQTSVCCLKLVGCNMSSSCVVVDKGERGWLTKVGVSSLGKIQLFHPLSNQRIMSSPVKLDLGIVRFVQLCKSFSLNYKDSCAFPVFGVHKAVLFPVAAASRGKEPDFAIIAIYQQGKLGYWKFGTSSWSLLDDINFMYDDVIEYRGQYYVVDRWGTVSWIDSSLQVHQYSPPLYGCGGQKHLVESGGDLYVVDRYFDGERRIWNDTDDIVFANRNIRRNRNRFRRNGNPKTIDFRVHKLDEELGTWVNVKSLGDRTFVLCNDCSFSASADDLVGGRENCIYFVDGDNYVRGGLSSECILVFQLEDGSIERLALLPQHTEMFWPPPSDNWVQL